MQVTAEPSFKTKYPAIINGTLVRSMAILIRLGANAYAAWSGQDFFNQRLTVNPDPNEGASKS